MITFEVVYGSCATILCLLVLLYMWKFKWAQRRVLEAASKLPMPLALPLVGHAYIAFGGIEKTTTSLNKFSRLSPGISCLWVGPVPLFWVSSPEDLKVILNSSKALEKGRHYKFLKPFLGNGLVTSPVSIWKRNRRALSPVFQSRNMASFCPIVNDVSKKLTENLKRFVGNGDVDVYEELGIHFAESVCRTVLGFKADVFNSSTARNFYTDLIKRLARQFLIRLSKPWLAIDWVFYFFHKKKIKEINILVDQLIYNMYKNLRSVKRTPTKIVKANTDNDDTNNFEEGEHTHSNYREILMDLLESNSNFTEEDVKFEIITTLLAAVDTSSSTLGFCLLALGNLQDVQEKLYKEIKQVFGDSDRDVTPEDLNVMPYLDCVIKESLRSHRTIPFTERKVTEDIKLSTCTIPAGGNIVININGVHMDPAVYPDPEKFDPERFTPENSAQRNPYSFLPFSAGPRNCIGKNYSLMTMKITLVNILRKYKVYTNTKFENIIYTAEVSMRSKNGYPIRFNFRYLR